MPNVVTYCRVSSEEQAQKDISIPAQRKALLRWVEEREDVEMLQDFVDEGESAYAPADKRPGFCQMIAFCRRRNVDHILVHKLDRFSRNQEESILFKSLLRKHGVTVKSITENYDPETPQGFLYEGMIEVINQFYSMNLATETLKGMRENAERGFVNGGRTPFGYRLERVTDAGGRTHGRLVPGPEAEVAVVREIFDLAVNQGLGSKRIANTLNKRGIPGPISAHWNCSTLDTMLNNRVYVGDQVWFKTRKVGRDGRARTAKDEHIITENAHESLIDRPLFEKRLEIAASRRFSARRSKTQPVTYLLSRLIRCQHCGNNFVGRRQKRKAGGEAVEYYRYYCGGYLNKGPSVCPSLPIQRDWLEGLVLDLLRAKICEPGLLDELERRVRERVEARRRTYGVSPQAVERKLAELERRIQNYYRAIGEGLDPLVCQRHIAELNGKKAVLEEESKVLMREDYYDRALDLNIGALRRFARSFQKEFDSLPFAARRQVVLYFVDRVEVVDRKVIRVHFKVPFDNNGIKLLTDEVTGAAQGQGASDILASEVHMRHVTGSHSYL